MLKNIKKTISSINKYSLLVERMCGKRKIIDMILSRLILKIPYDLYFDYCFYDKKWNKRKNYIIDDYIYCLRYNHGKESVCYDKWDLTLKLKPYIKRKIVRTIDLSYANFEMFVENLDSFFYKPVNGCGGDGVQKIYIYKNKSLRSLYDDIKRMPNGLLEETIEQHDVMKKLHPTLLQSIRFNVFKHKDGVKILFASIRTSSNKKAIVDNASSGGIYANIDLETGKIKTNAYKSIYLLKDIMNFDKRYYTLDGVQNHPVSGVSFIGFQIPYFYEAKKYVLDLVSNIDFYDRRFIGIDIAITQDGPDIIEANISRPGVTQLWQTSCKSTPLKPIIDKLLKE